MLLFFIGAVAMRGAGSTFNDLIDRKIDAKVERTRGRPLPSGRVSPRGGGGLPGRRRGSSGLASCCRSTASPSLLGLCSLIPVAVYPFMKRFTSWPQAVLGLAFSWGALIGWAAQTGGLAAPAIWLYLSCIAWTIGYDTIYAIQDRKDDVGAGVKSTALLFGEHLTFAVALFYLAAVLCAEIALLSVGRRPAGACRAARLRRASGLADPPAGRLRRGAGACACSAPTARGLRALRRLVRGKPAVLSRQVNPLTRSR